MFGVFRTKSHPIFPSQVTPVSRDCWWVGCDTDTTLMPLELWCDWISCTRAPRRAIMRLTPFWNSPYLAA